MENDLLAMLEIIATHLRQQLFCDRCDRKFISAVCTCREAKKDLAAAQAMIERASH